jgi:hypothetical protein
MSAVFARIYWMMFGPLLLILMLYKISDQTERLGLADLAFGLLLIGLPLARWVEFRGGDPRTTTGDPAEPRHLQRYSAAALVIGLVGWGAVKLLG